MALESAFNSIDDLNESWPDGAADSRRDGDDHLRGIKKAVRASFGKDHDKATGRHTVVVLTVQSDNPTPSGTFGYLYTKQVSGVTELFYMDEDGHVLQLTAAGALNITFPAIPEVPTVHPLCG